VNGSIVSEVIQNAVSGTSTYLSTSTIVDLANGDFVELQVFQNSTFALGFGDATEFGSYLAVQQIAA
jgi:hypothetical protein